jgi:L-aminopeptidase/D-esterase-like protein
VTQRAITDVPGILVGHADDAAALTGVTVVRAAGGAVAGVDVRGGAPGTRETDLLNPTATVHQVHAIALCGGSAFGLAAASGVMERLREEGIGFPAGPALVPIVPAAVIFDLALGAADRFPDAAMGYTACATAGSTTAEGCVGVGMGASIGKIHGMNGAMKSGVGTWSEILPDGTIVGALVVVNAWGDVFDEQGALIAGVRNPADGALLNTSTLLRRPDMRTAFGGGRDDRASITNTTLAVIATDAQLTKAEATRLALMAHDGLARTIRPVHTPFDGDTIFALATGRRPAPSMVQLGSIAAEVTATAVVRAVRTATARGGLPALGR